MKESKKWVISGVLFCASLIILNYIMLEYRSSLPAVLAASIFFLVVTGSLIQQISTAIKTYQKKQSMLLESRLTELQNQLTYASEMSKNAAEANAYYTQKIGEGLAGFEDELIENQRKGNILMQRIITTQTKATKVLVKYNQINTNKLVDNIHNEYQLMEQSLDNTISNTAVELRKIGENIIKTQRELPEQLLAEASEWKTQETPSDIPITEGPVEETIAEPIIETPVEEASIEPITETPVEEFSIEPVIETPVEEASIEPIIETPVEEASIEPVTEAPVEEASIEPITEMAVEAAIAESITEAAAPAVDMPEDPNAQLTPDQIAALFATPDTPSVAASAEVTTTDDITIEQPEMVWAAETPAVDMPEDPNAQLSPEQIAALFATTN